MDRKTALQQSGYEDVFDNIHGLYARLDDAFQEQFKRSVPLPDTIVDRWERATRLGFGKGASIYDSSYVFGEVKVGEHTWIGPFTIIDGSGGLSIGNNCTISAGVHVYTHDNVGQTVTGGKMPIERVAVAIGDRTYIAPNVIISKGITIGSCCIIGANSFVNRSIPDNSVAAGTPAKIIGKVVVEESKFHIEYFK
ncbi:MAG TPA: acyltransferase [Chitinophagaceae bacterium]|nr:acyltransferase [Chitinophagaceae bacterium]